MLIFVVLVKLKVANVKLLNMVSETDDESEYENRYTIHIRIHDTRNPQLATRNTRFQIPSTLQSTVIIAVATTILTIPVTTADVAASPTADALRPH